jgi:hypothetical protein
MTHELTRRFGRLGRRRHLTDAELLTLVERASTNAHLSGCERCATRHAQILCVMADLDAIHAEADAVFDDRRLAHQRAHVLRRLERNHGPARVLPFPAAAGGSASLTTIGRRWVAAAAIGGVVVGIFTGGLLRHRGDTREELRLQTNIDARGPAVSAGALVPADFRLTPDELLLGELEDAVIARPRPAELHAIDELTPVAR